MAMTAEKKSSGKRSGTARNSQQKGKTSQTGKAAVKKTSAKQHRRTAHEIDTYKDQMAFEAGITILVFLIVSLFFYLSFLGLCGRIGVAVTGISFGLFGWLAWLIPLFVVVSYVFALVNPRDRRVPRKVASAGLFFLVLDILKELLFKQKTLLEYYSDNSARNHNHLECLYQSLEDVAREGKGGGGMIGRALCDAFESILGIGGAVAILLALLCLFAYIFLGPELMASFRKRNAYHREMEEAYDEITREGGYQEPVYRIPTWNRRPARMAAGVPYRERGQLQAVDLRMAGRKLDAMEEAEELSRQRTDKKPKLQTEEPSKKQAAKGSRQQTDKEPDRQQGEKESGAQADVRSDQQMEERSRMQEEAARAWEEGKPDRQRTVTGKRPDPAVKEQVTDGQDAVSDVALEPQEDIASIPIYREEMNQKFGSASDKANVTRAAAPEKGKVVSIVSDGRLLEVVQKMPSAGEDMPEMPFQPADKRSVREGKEPSGPSSVRESGNLAFSGEPEISGDPLSQMEEKRPLSESMLSQTEEEMPLSGSVSSQTEEEMPLSGSVSSQTEEEWPLSDMGREEFGSAVPPLPEERSLRGVGWEEPESAVPPLPEERSLRDVGWEEPGSAVSPLPEERPLRGNVMVSRPTGERPFSANGSEVSGNTLPEEGMSWSALEGHERDPFASAVMPVPGEEEIPAHRIRPSGQAGASSAAGMTSAADAPKKRSGGRTKDPSRKKREAEDDAVSETVHALDNSKQDNQVIPYQFPPVSLLALPARPAGQASDDKLRNTALLLKETLHSFHVEVSLGAVTCGPTVTRYEVHPAQGVRVNKITNLADDLKLSLAAQSIRIEAPIPGKSAVGIEVPNESPSAVHFRELLEGRAFEQADSPVSFAVGKDISGKVIVTDIAKMPHLLIAGATGSGKSVCINTLIMSILYKADPNEVRLIMIDPKVVELSCYNGIPHLFCPVVTDAKEAAAALNWAVREMMDRYNKFKELGVRNIKGYNEKIKSVENAEEAGYPYMPLLVIIVDEFADLMMVASKEVEDAVCRLAQLARAAGIHLILATQRPSVNVITGVIKANIPSRIAFSVSSLIDSRTILDKGGAEKLLGKGDMLFFPSGYSEPVRLQGAFVSDQEVTDVVAFLCDHNKTPVYNEKVTEIVEAPASDSRAAEQKKPEVDEYFEEAGRFVIDSGRAAAGQLQRRFSIGFNRAGRIIDQLHKAGVVGPAVGTKPRKVLMTVEQFEEYLETGGEKADTADGEADAPVRSADRVEGPMFQPAGREDAILSQPIDKGDAMIWASGGDEDAMVRPMDRGDAMIWSSRGDEDVMARPEDAQEDLYE